MQTRAIHASDQEIPLGACQALTAAQMQMHDFGTQRMCTGKPFFKILSRPISPESAMSVIFCNHNVSLEILNISLSLQANGLQHQKLLCAWNIVSNCQRMPCINNIGCGLLALLCRAWKVQEPRNLFCRALRTHLINMSPIQMELNWPTFSSLRKKWAGKV